jgi:hypothetical protein
VLRADRAFEHGKNMAIIIHYEKYSFQPPEKIGAEKELFMRSHSLAQLQKRLRDDNSEERQRFIAESRGWHGFSMACARVFLMCLGYYVALGGWWLLQELVPDWRYPVPSPLTAINIVAVLAFILVFLVCRPYLESYSSFQRYQRQKLEFFLRKKKEMNLEGEKVG